MPYDIRRHDAQAFINADPYHFMLNVTKKDRSTKILDSGLKHISEKLIGLLLPSYYTIL